MAIPRKAGPQMESRRGGEHLLLDMVIGSFPGDDDVVDVALPESGIGDSYEMRLLVQFLDGVAAYVAHS